MTLARIPDSQGVVAAVGIPQRDVLAPGAGPAEGEVKSRYGGPRGPRRAQSQAGRNSKSAIGRRARRSLMSRTVGVSRSLKMRAEPVWM